MLRKKGNDCDNGDDSAFVVLRFRRDDRFSEQKSECLRNIMDRQEAL